MTDEKVLVLTEPVQMRTLGTMAHQGDGCARSTTDGVSLIFTLDYKGSGRTPNVPGENHEPITIYRSRSDEGVPGILRMYDKQENGNYARSEIILE